LNSYRFFRNCVGYLIIASLLLANVKHAHANPEGGVVASGAADIVGNGNNLDIYQQTDRAVIDWRSFNIAEGEHTQFHQPGSQSMTLNRVNDMNPSSIQGRLTANGNVIIVNPNGVMFGANSQIDVNGLVATSADIDNSNFMAGDLRFDRAGNANAIIKNEGRITAAQAGLVGFVAPHVENSGVIEARLGRVQLSSGDTMTLDMYGDGLMEVAVQGDIGRQIVKNTGRIQADGGRIALTAAAGRNVVDSLIEVSGTLRARSVAQKNGEIIISAAGSNAVAGNKAQDKGQKKGYSEVRISGDIDATGVNAGEKGGKISALGDIVLLEGNAKLDASGYAGGGDIKIGGDYQGLGDTATALMTWVGKDAQIKVDATHDGDGGRAILWADHTTKFYGDISARGGQYGGDGGFVEVSGKEYLVYKGYTDTRADMGETGLLFLDPADIIIANGSGDSAADGTATFAGSPSGTAGTILSGDAGPTTIYESELQGIAAGTNISLAATNSITINDLADNNLNLLQNAGRSVTFTSATFSMNAGDTITTAGGAVNINTTGSATVGAIAAGAGLVTFNVGGASTVAGVISGTGGITKTGAGTLTLNAANTNTGLTTVTAGTLAAGINNALSTGGLTVNGGTYNIGTFTDSVGTVTLQSGSITGSSGVLTSTAAFAMQSGTVSAILAGTSGMNKTTAGTVTLSGVNTFTGTTSVTGGTLAAGVNNALSTGALTINGGTYDIGTYTDSVGTVTLTSGSIVGTSGVLTSTAAYAMQAGTVSAILAGSNGMNKTTGGTVTLTGANTFTGALTLSAGTLRAEGNAGALGAGTLTLSGGSLVLAGDTGINFGRNTTVSVGSTITSDRTTSGAAVTHTLGNLTFANNWTLTTAAGANVSSGTAGLAFATYSTTSAGAAPTVSVAANTSLSIGALTDSAATTTITKSGVGTLYLTGASAGWTRAGSRLSITNGDVILEATNALGTGTNTDIEVSNSAGTTSTFNLNGFDQGVRNLTFNNGGAAANSVNNVATGAGTLTLGGNVTYTATNNPAGSTISGNLALGSATRTFTINDSTNATNDLSITAAISGTGGLTKAGAGRLVLSGNSAYSGTTTLSAGTLTATGNAAALGAGNLSLGGGTLELAGDTGLSFGRNTTVTASTSILLDRATSGAGITHTLGTLSQGNQTLTVSSNNVNSGNSSLVFGATTITNTSTFNTGANTRLTLGALSNGGSNRSFVKSGVGELYLSAAAGTWTTTGNGLTINNGSVLFGATNALGAATNTNITVNNTAGGTALFDLNGYNQTIGTLTLGGTGGTSTSVNNVATGAGTLTLGGNMTYNATGNPLGSTISGNLALGAATRTFTINDSTGSADELNVTAIISGASGLTKAGTGTMVLSGENTYTGLTTVSAGTLAAGINDALSTGALTVNGGTYDIGTYTDSIGTVTLQGNGFITGTTGVMTSTAAYAMQSGTVSAILAGSSGMNKSTAGTVTLTGANTFTGTLSITAGTLRGEGNAAALGAGSVSINNATLELIGDTSLNFGRDLSLAGTGNVVVGRINSGAAVTHPMGNFTTGANSLNLTTSNITSGNAGLVLGAAAINGNNTFNAAADTTITVGALSNAGTNRSMTKSGLGDLVFSSAAGTWTNNGSSLIINNGNVYLAASDALGAGVNTNVTVNNTAGGTSVFDLDGYDQIIGTLTLGGASGTSTSVNNVATGAGTLTLGGNVTYTNTGNPLGSTISGNLSLGAATRTFTIGDSGNSNPELDITAIVSGTGGLIKAGAGTLKLSGANTYTGATTINAGVLSVSSLADGGVASNIGASTNAAANFVMGGGTLLYTGGDVTIDRNFTLTAATTNTFDIDGAANLTIGGASTATTGALAKAGTGILTLAGANLYTGLTTINAGTLAYGANNALATGGITINNGSTLDIGTYNDSVGLVTLADGYITGSSGTLTSTSAFALQSGSVSAILAGTSGVNKTTAGTVLLSGANTYSGTTTLTAGTLQVGNDAAFGTSTLSLSGGTVEGDGTARTLGNAISLIVSGSTIGGTSDLTFNGLLTNTGDYTLNIDNASHTYLTGGINLSNNGTPRTLTIAGAGEATLGVVANGAAASGSLAYGGTATVTLNAQNTFTGDLTVSSGSVKSAVANALAGNLTVNGGEYNMNGFDDTVGIFTLGGGALNGVGDTLTASSFNVDAGDIYANLAGAGSMVKSSAGTVTLYGSNTFTGTVQIDGGNLALSGGNALADTANVSFDDPAAELRLLGNETIGSLSSNGLVIMNANTLTLAGADDADFSGVISGTGNLVKSGTAVQTFSGANTYTGTTSVTGGVLALGLSDAFASSGLSVNGGEFRMGAFNESFNAVTLVSGSITGSGGILTSATEHDLRAGSVSAVLAGNAGMRKTTAGTLTLSGANTLTGTSTLEAGSVVIAHNNAFGSSDLVFGGASISASGARTISNAVLLDANTVIGGAADLTLSGLVTNNADRTLTLSNTGLTTFSGGINLSNDASTRTLTVNGAGNASFGVIANGGTATSGHFTMAGSGLIDMAGQSTFTGNTNVNSGTIRVQTNNALADASQLVVGAGGTFNLNGYSDTVASVNSAGTFQFGTGSTLTTAGTQSYTVANGGNVNLVSGGNITVSNNASDFTGTLSIDATGYDVSVLDANSLTLGSVLARNIFARTTSGNITLSDDLVSSATTDNAIVLVSGANFTNTAGADALQTGAGGSWRVYSASPLLDNRGGLTPQFKQYNASYGDALLGTGNGFVYSVAPTVTVGLTGTASRSYNGTTSATLGLGNFSFTGGIDGDSLTVDGGYAASYDDKNVGNGKTINVTGMSGLSASNAGVAVYGYQLANAAASAAIGEITAASLTITANDQVKDFGDTFTFAGTEFTSSGLFAGDSVTSASLASAGAASGAASSGGTPYPITVSGAVGVGLMNYTISYINGSMTVLGAPTSDLPGGVQNFFNNNSGGSSSGGGGWFGEDDDAFFEIFGCGYNGFSGSACAQNTEDFDLDDQNTNRRLRNSSRRMMTPPPS
jgi:filamentous hemagglutinin family protein